MSKSVVEFYPEREKHRCGYCKKPDSSCSQGMWAHQLTTDDYQNLIDRGWRRSGKYCYKPKMDETCCPLYTIKCNASGFKLSKSQKKLIKKMNKFLSKDNDVEISENDEKSSVKINEQNQIPTPSQECDEQTVLNTLRNKKHIQVDVNNLVPSSPREKTKNSELKDKKPEQVENDKPLTVSEDISRIPSKKAKQLRLQRRQEKCLLKGIDFDSKPKPNPNTGEKTLEEFLADLPDGFRERLQIKLVRTAPASPEWLASATASYQLYIKYQVAIHGDKASECTEDQFRRFLVKSPLQADFPDDGPSVGYGSFHQQYWLDGELIAVGVIDILPKCVSSVYLFYNPNYSHLSLGTYGALIEVAFTRQLQVKTESIKSYYMGFYIHSCPKMRYKGNYSPSFLLCPETYKWFPLEECCKKLEQQPYCRLNPDVDATDTDSCEKKDLLDILVLAGSTYMTYGLYKEHKKRTGLRIRKSTPQDTDEQITLHYGKLVGKTTSQNMLLVKE